MEKPPLKSGKNLQFTLTYAPGLQDSAPRGVPLYKYLFKSKTACNVFIPLRELFTVPVSSAS